MRNYWKKFFTLTVLADRVDMVNEILNNFETKITASDYNVYDVDGEKIAHYTLIILSDGKYIYDYIVATINNKLYEDYL